MLCWTFNAWTDEVTKVASKINKNENISCLEITEIVLLHCSIVNIFGNKYQQDSSKQKGVLHIFVPNRSFNQLFDILIKVFIFLKTVNAELSNITVWLTD